MKAQATESSTGEQMVKRASHADSFAKVLDGRKQPIRGLWERNGRYYAQMTIENPITGAKKVTKVALKDSDGNPVATAAAARAELDKLKVQRTAKDLPVLGRTPKFKDYVVAYLAGIEGKKSAGTVQKEGAILGRWVDAIGELRLDQIKRVHVNRFIDKRIEKASPRTINLDVIGLRNALKRAMEDGTILRLPTEGLRPLKVTTHKRPLFTSADLDAVCSAALDTKVKDGKEIPVTKNGPQFVDYVRLMAYSGTRRNEALGLQWGDVDFDAGQLHVRRQVTYRKTLQGIQDLKGKEDRVVDFNPKLRAHLESMKKRRAPDCKWVFPSPQRGSKDIPAHSFQESLVASREKAKKPNFGFHDCRHHFISMCVMSGVDFMTIAAWVGHKDGGVLIGKVYGHLANEHRQAMAAKLNFGPVALPAATA